MLVPWRVFTVPSKSYQPPISDDMVPDYCFFLRNGKLPSHICDIGSFEAVGKRRVIGMRPRRWTESPPRRRIYIVDSS